MSSPGGSTPERQRRRRTEESPEPSAAASTASVLGNPDLLADILLRVGSPTWLVRAALASKSWLRVASDPAFLDRFRALHPPRVLVLSVHSAKLLLPVPQPPELAAATRLAGRTLDNLGHEGRCIDYCNGRLLVQYAHNRSKQGYAVASLLHKARKKKFLPPPPPLDSYSHGFGLSFSHRQFFFLGDGNNAISCLYLSMNCNKVKVHADFSILQSGVWGVTQSAVMELEQEPYFTLFSGHKLLSDEKVYMMTGAGCILALDLATATFSAIELPDGAEHCECLKFSRAKQSGIYLICATGYQLRVWHGDGAGQWVLVDTVSVREACTKLNVQAGVPVNGDTSPVWIVGVGDNAEFVILQLVASQIIFCMQLANRAVEKVVEGLKPNIGRYICPITMVWPPFLPASPALE